MLYIYIAIQKIWGLEQDEFEYFYPKKLLKDLTPDKKKRKYNYINSKYQTCRALRKLF